MKKFFTKHPYVIGLLVGSLLTVPHAFKAWTKHQVEQQLHSPEAVAILELIAQHHNTDDPDGYRKLLDGSTFESFDRHPKIETCTIAGIASPTVCSTAAGRYQILGEFWTIVSSEINLRDFSPHSQDLAALYIVRNNGALADFQNGDVDAGLNKLNRVWRLDRSPEYLVFDNDISPGELKKLSEQYHTILGEETHKYLGEETHEY